MRIRTALPIAVVLLATVLVLSACSGTSGSGAGTPGATSPGASGSGSASSGGSTTDATPPAAIIAAQCTRCHDVSRIKKAQHDEAGWQATLARMRGKGAQIDDAQAAAVAKFLVGGGASQL
jgi:hypothetical protein